MRFTGDEMDFEIEIRDLKRRVCDLEGAVNVLAGKFGELHPEIASLKSTTIERFDGIDTGFGRLTKKLDDVNTQVWALRDDFPEMIGKAVKSVIKDAGD